MTTPATYTHPTLAASPAPLESWSELRCPACVSLGWEASRLLLKIYGVMVPTEARLQVKCARCKSTIEWIIGTTRFSVAQPGPKNHKKRNDAYE